MTLRARIVPFALLSGLLLSGMAYADDRADVLAANQAVDAAFSKLDIKAFDSLWAHDDSVTTIHPSSKTVVVGWTAVRKSWAEGTLSRYKEISVAMESPNISVANNVALVVGIEKVRGTRANGDVAEFSALTTNVYEKRNGHWLMVHHHASRMP
jgi:ketosteroid isomerase-like protein